MNVSVILSDSSCKDGNAAEPVSLKVLYEKYELNFDVYNFNFWLVLCLVNLKLKRQYLPQLIRYKSYVVTPTSLYGGSLEIIRL